VNQTLTSKHKPEQESWQCTMRHKDLHACKSGALHKVSNRPSSIGDVCSVIRVIQLENEVAHLTKTLRSLVDEMDHDELRAAMRLKAISPDNDTLRIWVENSKPPVGMADQPAERPW